jgi:glycerophosphoryl diester phosphodiesterase
MGRRNAPRRPIPALHDAPIIFGHRGYSALAPENTLAAFGLIRRHGVPGVELDVRLCATGEVVVSHDRRLERTAGVAAEIADLSADELARTDVGSWFDPSFSNEGVPQLSAVFELLGDSVVYDLELKADSADEPTRRLAQAVVALIRRHGLGHRSIVSSFNPIVLAWTRRADPRIPTALIYSAAPEVPAPARRPIAQVILRNEILKPGYARFAAEQEGGTPPFPEVPRLVWTVDEATQRGRVVAAGAYGLISNDPAGLVSTVDPR